MITLLLQQWLTIYGPPFRYQFATNVHGGIRDLSCEAWILKHWLHRDRELGNCIACVWDTIQRSLSQYEPFSFLFQIINSCFCLAENQLH